MYFLDLQNKSEAMLYEKQGVRICTVWWSGTRNIRTRYCSRVLPRNIEGEDNPSALFSIIVDIDGVHQRINDSASVFNVADVTTLERNEPIHYSLFRQEWFFFYFFSLF